MVKRLMHVAVAVLVLAGAASTLEAQGRQARPTVALLDFDFGAIQPWWSGNTDLGRQVADMLVDELVNEGSYRVIERKRIDAVLNEQSLKMANVAPDAMVRICKTLGVQYLILGSVTRFALEQNNKSLAGGFGVAVNIAGLNRTEARATVAITARMVDAATGEILASTKGQGLSTRKGVQVDTRGGSALPNINLNLNTTDFQVTVMGEATEAAIRDAAARLVAAKGRLN